MSPFSLSWISSQRQLILFHSPPPERQLTSGGSSMFSGSTEFPWTLSRTEVHSLPHVWKVFCRALGSSTNLLSGDHPQTNGHLEHPPALRGVCPQLTDQNRHRHFPLDGELRLPTSPFSQPRVRNGSPVGPAGGCVVWTNTETLPFHCWQDALKLLLNEDTRYPERHLLKLHQSRTALKICLKHQYSYISAKRLW